MKIELCTRLKSCGHIIYVSCTFKYIYYFKGIKSYPGDYQTQTKALFAWLRWF